MECQTAALVFIIHNVEPAKTRLLKALSPSDLASLSLACPLHLTKRKQAELLDPRRELGCYEPLARQANAWNAQAVLIGKDLGSLLKRIFSPRLYWTAETPVRSLKVCFLMVSGSETSVPQTASYIRSDTRVTKWESTAISSSLTIFHPIQFATSMGHANARSVVLDQVPEGLVDVVKKTRGIDFLDVTRRPMIHVEMT